VQATPSRTELEIQLDDGTQLKGRLLTATAGMLRLSCTDEIVEVQRDRVVKILELSLRSRTNFVDCSATQARLPASLQVSKSQEIKGVVSF
jgi:hypothetical protein